MGMYLFQVTPMISEANPTSIAIGIGLVLAFALFLIIGARTSKKGSKGGGKVRFSKGTFRKKAAGLSLSKTETKTLENLGRDYQIKNLYSLLSNSPQLNSVLKRTIMEINHQPSTPQSRESQKLTLYRIKQKIERNESGNKAVSKTSQMKLGQKLAITPESGGRFQSVITSNLRDMLGMQIPFDSKNNQIRWKKWTKVKIFFWKNNGQGFSFISKVIGYNEVRGIPSLFIQHSNSVKQAQQRRFRRKEMNKPVYFYPVRIMTTGVGRNQRKKAMIETKNSALGTIVEISAGGCSIRSTYPLPAGSLIKIEFETGVKSSVSALGKIKTKRRIKPAGGIMHIMFTKISSQNLNKINSFIYSFETAGGKRSR